MARRSSFFAHVAAALMVVLLQLVLAGGAASAQTITNTAQARWSVGATEFSGRSNEVAIPVTEMPATIRAFRADSSGSLGLTYQNPQCGNTGGTQQATASVSTAQSTKMVEQTATLRAGQDLYFEVRMDQANVDPSAIDSLLVTITTSSGDSEDITIFETGPDTGIFVGVIATRHQPPAPVQGDCRLSLDGGETITIGAHLPGQATVHVAVDVTVLADPFGVVFDSETGEPVSGARVTLVDAATGLPATVFAEDGVTPWPSSVISGATITDGAGNTYPMDPGEYWFPLTNLGQYRLVIEPPAPYSAPSVVSPADLADLSRPDGRAFIINDGSYGGTFMLVDPTPVQIDVPLDRPSLVISLTKSASRATAQPGDVVFYTVTARNQDPTRVKRNVVVNDSPSKWLRLRKDSVHVDGTAAPDAVTVSPTGDQLTVQLGDIAGGSSKRVTYAMVVRPDAPPGHAENNAESIDSLGRVARASASVKLERDNIASRMTIIGRITAGPCTLDDPRIGIPGVRVMMEDGSFAITDADGRYHFEGVVPGTHVVQASPMTLPEGAEFVDCHRSTRNAGSANSRFAIGQGGSLIVADFHAIVPESYLAELTTEQPGEDVSTDIERAAASATEAKAAEAGEGTDWLALGDGEDGWLTPEADANPRSPAIRVAIRHRKGQTVNLSVDGKPVNPLNFDGVQSPEKGRYAVSTWRGVPLLKERTDLKAEIINSFGEVSKTFEREVYFTTTPRKVEFLPELSKLIADGRTNPVVAVRVLDRNNRPLREGVSGEFKINSPYQSAEQIRRQQLNQLTGLGDSSARWVVRGDEGIALIELAPTMVSGSLRLDFIFDDGKVRREQELESWIKPGDIEWTVVGLAEGSIGARTVADNMERAGRFDSDLGDKARVALYAKGRVLGKFLVTLAYDSAKQRDDQRVLGTLDPNAYYTVFADGSSRRFDAASREKLYVRIETATFYALYGDFMTGFDQTRLGSYNRTATGVKAEAQLGQFHAQGFAADVETRYRRDEFQGQGITGPYRLSSRGIVPNSENVRIETRDRFRSELIVSTRQLTRFMDYDIDLLSGTLTFKEPVLSRDFDLNPQFVVVEYETDEMGKGELNAGLRADWTDASGKIRLGATAITDKGEGARTDLGAIDLKARVGEATEIRAELGASRTNGQTATGWLVEAQHQAGDLDVLAYARSLDADYGSGHQNAGELGRRKVGVDARVRLGEELSVTGSLWQDDSLTDDNRRRAAQAQVNYTTRNTDLRAGIAHFSDRLNDGTRNTSTVLEGGVTQRLLDNKLELGASTSIALDDAESADLPARHRATARYALSNSVRLVGLYEVAKGDGLDARTLRAGVEVAPWQGGQIVTALGKQRIDEFGDRSFAAFGLSQSVQVSPSLTLDATLDGNRTLGSTPAESDILNPAHPVASGGHLGQNGSSFEDFTAVTLGAAWRKDRWSATARGEYRDGEFADRAGFTFGAIRQLGEGSVVGSGLTWTSAESNNGAQTEILDAALAFAHRPDESEVAMLGKLEYRSDMVRGAVAGEVGPAGRTALLVTGNAESRRLVASLSTNWSPRGWDEIDDVDQQTRRDEYGLFLAARYNFDRFEGFDMSGTSVLAGAEARIGITDRVELGAMGTVRANLDDDVMSYSFGPQIGVVPADGMLLTLGYNVTGFRDEDFSAQRHTDKGVYLSARVKFDADSFSFLGLDR